MDDALFISKNPIHIMKGIQSKFKLKDFKMKKPYVYLSAELSTMDNEQGDELWSILFDKYCAAIVKNV